MPGKRWNKVNDGVSGNLQKVNIPTKSESPWEDQTGWKFFVD